MRTEIDGKIYKQVAEKETASCRGCVGLPRTEQGDILCDKLIIASGGECDGCIWKEVDVTEEMGAEDE